MGKAEGSPVFLTAKVGPIASPSCTRTRQLLSMSRLGQTLVFAVLIASYSCFVQRVATAQVSEFDRARLAGEIEAAAKNLNPGLFPDLDASKAQVLMRVVSAEQFFDSRTNRENRDAWLTYLDVEPLVEKIESDASALAIARDAIDLRYRLIGTAPGLELTVLRNLRDSVEKLIEAVRFRDKEKSVESLAKQLGTLAQLVRELDKSPSAEDSASISALLGVLEASGQAKAMVDSMRNVFGRPNVAILVGEPMVQSAVNRNVNQTRPVRDCILGTRIIGDATMNAVVTADLVPAVGSARVNVSLVGHIVSKNIGYNGPVRLRTVGYGDVNVSRSVSVNESGITLEPAYSRAVLKTEITAIEHKLGLVRKIAKKRAAQQKPRADKIAVEKMRNQVGGQFATRTSEMTSMTPPDLLEKIRPVLKRLSLEEPTRYWGSTEQAVYIDSTFRRRDQISTVVSRPPITQSYDAAVQIHESVVDNAFAPILAGRTLTERQLNEMLDKAGRPVPEKTGEESEPPFEIDFARLRPVVFEARDQTIRVGVRGTRFAQGTRELKRAMEITAIYEPAKTTDGVVILLRKGDVNVDFPGGRRLSVSQAGLRRTIQKKFSDLFPDVLLDRPLEIPSDSQVEAIRGRIFHPRMVDAKDGWLTITVR